MVQHAAQFAQMPQLHVL